MVSARRHDIVDRLVASGPMSVKDLARSIGAQPSALYHHVKQLVGHGLVVEAGHRVENRKREQLYATPAPRVRLFRAMQERRNAPVFKRIVGSLGRQMERDFRRGIASPRARTEGPSRNLMVMRLVAAPSATTLRKINEHLAAISELMWQSDGDGGELVAFAGALTPAGREPPRRKRG
jgi:DNA-binding transcriptional ArsR family regulator